MLSSWTPRLSILAALAALVSAGTFGCGGSKGSGHDLGRTQDLAGFVQPTPDFATTSTDFAASSDDMAASGDDQGVSPTGCTEITVNGFSVNQADGTAADYIGALSPDTGDSSDPDSPNLEFYGSSLDPSYDGESTGTFDLSKGGDANYATCSRCLRFVQDPDETPKVFYQSTGTMSLATGSDQLNGAVSATLTDVTLVEVTIDPDTFTSTPVAGGACLHIPTAQIDVTNDVPDGGTVPAGWMCDPTYYGDGDCDCGCGVADVDCTSSDVSACDYCDDTGSCSTDTCPGTITPNNNATCTP